MELQGKPLTRVFRAVVISLLLLSMTALMLSAELVKHRKALVSERLPQAI